MFCEVLDPQILEKMKNTEIICQVVKFDGLRQLLTELTELFLGELFRTSVFKNVSHR